MFTVSTVSAMPHPCFQGGRGKLLSQNCGQGCHWSDFNLSPPAAIDPVSVSVAVAVTVAVTATAAVALLLLSLLLLLLLLLQLQLLLLLQRPSTPDPTRLFASSSTLDIFYPTPLLSSYMGNDGVANGATCADSPGRFFTVVFFLIPAV